MCRLLDRSNPCFFNPYSAILRVTLSKFCEVSARFGLTKSGRIILTHLTRWSSVCFFSHNHKQTILREAKVPQRTASWLTTIACCSTVFMFDCMESAYQSVKYLMPKKISISSKRWPPMVSRAQMQLTSGWSDQKSNSWIVVLRLSTIYFMIHNYAHDHDTSALLVLL